MMILVDPPARVKGRATHHNTRGRWAVASIIQSDLRPLSCHALREQAEDVAAMPLPLRGDAWYWLAAISLEATDRALNGCPCGSLVTREPGTCGREA